MTGKFEDLTGRRFGRLIVTKMHSHGTKNTPIKWECICDCGKTTIVRVNDLRWGKTQSCSCLQREKVKRTIHGDSKTRLHRIWRQIHSRCSNANLKDYKNYGGRGIIICSEWYEYILFRDWALSNGYSDDLTIDRINVNGNYEPNNCRWTTKTVQANNTRSNHYITYKGKRQTLAQWSRELNIDYFVLKSRIRYHWSIKRAFTEPIQNKGRHKIACVL